MTRRYLWTFSRLGGFDQVVLTNADDIKNLTQLDPKLWAALACPANDLHFDEKTLALIDQDDDGRIRLPEVIRVTEWLCRVLRNPEVVLEPADYIKLKQINTDAPEGESLHKSAQHLLTLLDRADAEMIRLADVTEQQELIANARFNGDGIITPAAAHNSETRKLIETVLQNSDPECDASGVLGINAAAVKHFYAAVSARLEWLSRAEPGWVPDGVDGKAAAESLAAVRAKIDDYFSRCRASHYDPRAAAQLNRPLNDWANFNQELLSADSIEIADFPLALITPDAILPLEQGLNPAWEARVQTLKDTVIQPILGTIDALDFDQWLRLTARFDDYQNWLNGEAGKIVSALDSEQLQTLLNNDSQQQLMALIEADLAVQPQVKALTEVEALLRYRLHLKTLLSNFVNFSDFYTRQERAIFEAGTLYLDGRACDLSIEVHDVAQHATLAGLSNCYLAYCHCTRKDGATKTIVSAFTKGSPDYLMVGRNGIFYDRDGIDWDANIIKIIEKPISVRQAFFSPYKRFIRFLESQAEQRAQAAEAANEDKLQTATTQTINLGDNTDALAPIIRPKFDLSMLAALGIAVGGLATAFGLMLQAFFGLGWLMPIGLLGLILLISLPSMFIAWLKLRHRTLAPLLDASGWAVNSQVKINTIFGATLTQVACIPRGSPRIASQDPYRSKNRGRKVAAILLGLSIVAGLWWWQSQTAPTTNNQMPEQASLMLPITLP